MTSTQHAAASADGTPTVELTVNGTSRQLPVVAATEGNDGIVVSSLLKETGLVTVDPGFMNTASCESSITYIDGDQGILRYRGYPIEQLAEQSTFLEVAYLLIHGELPSPADFEAFSERVNRHTLVPEGFRAFLSSFPRGGHPMSILASAINALATYYPESLNPHDDEAVELATVLILAKIRTITSYVHRSMLDEPLMYPDYARGYVDDFLRMSFARPYEQWESNPVLVSAMDKLLILHADHEQNCSTSTVRMVGSSNANLYASVAAGINALSGPSHGGANEAVLLMLENIRTGGDSVETFMKQALPDYTLPEITSETFEGMRAELLELRQRWNETKPGETLELTFSAMRRASVPRPTAGRESARR